MDVLWLLWTRTRLGHDVQPSGRIPSSDMFCGGAESNAKNSSRTTHGQNAQQQASTDTCLQSKADQKRSFHFADRSTCSYFLLCKITVKLSNAIFIDRKNHKKAIESTTQAVADMKKHNVRVQRCFFLELLLSSLSLQRTCL